MNLSKLTEKDILFGALQSAWKMDGQKNTDRELTRVKTGTLARPVFGVAILAAGASVRMGEPKLVLPWGETTMVGHLIRQWQIIGAREIALVLAAANQAVTAELDRLAFPLTHRIVNPHPEQGMFSSIQCAARWTGWDAELSHWVLALGDQPQLQAATLAALVECGSAHPQRICQLSYQNRPRHPIWLPRTFWRRLRDTDATTMRVFLQNQKDEIYLCDYCDAGLEMDIDRPEDYQAAMNFYFKRHESTRTG